MKKQIAKTVLGAVVLGFAAGLQAQPFVDYTASLGGTSIDHKWTSFALPAGVSSGISGTAGQWASNNLSGIAADGGNAAYTVFVPTSAPGTATYAAETTDFLAGGSGVYTFFSATHFNVSSTSSLSGLKTLVLQLSIAEGLATGAGGAPTEFLSAPSLTLFLSGGGSTTVGLADFSLQEYSQPTFFPAVGLTANVETHGFQWDLSGVGGTITGYTVDFQLAYHGIFIGADAAESTATHASSVLTTVPEPSTYALMALGLGMLVIVRRRLRA